MKVVAAQSGRSGRPQRVHVECAADEDIATEGARVAGVANGIQGAKASPKYEQPVGRVGIWTDRWVPMNDAAERILKELCDNARRRNLKYLFTNPKTKTHYTTVKTAWKTACKLAEIVDLHFHDLRHYIRDASFGWRRESWRLGEGDGAHSVEHDDAVCSRNGRGQAPSGPRGSGATGQGYQDA